MKKIKQAIAILIAVALLLEPCTAAGSMKEVKAADTGGKVYEQMKVTDVSIRNTDANIDKDALEIGDEGVKLPIDVKAEVPEGWAISEITLFWYSLKDELGSQSLVEKFDTSNQPEDGIYSMELSLHKYSKKDIYYLASVYVTYVDVKNVENYYGLYGDAAEYEIVASEAKPVEFEWYVENDKDIFDLASTNYTGSADFTILSATGNDTKAPNITGLKMKSKGVLNKSKVTEIDVTLKEEGSGIQSMALMSITPDFDMDLLVFETEELEKYVGKQTITATTDGESLEYRTSGNYYVASLAVVDFAGNMAVYEIDENEKYLVSEIQVENEDGSFDETVHKIKTIKYSVCDVHIFRGTVTPATTSANGNVCMKCKYCGTVKPKTKKTIAKIKSVKLSKTSYVYDGKVKKPAVTVYDSKGKKIDSDNYKVTYPSSCKNVGEYKVKVVFMNNYKGTVYQTYTIKPKGTSITSRSGGSKKITLMWNKQSVQTSGYQVACSTNSNFKTYSTMTIGNKNTTTVTISGLKAKKKYYVKVRTYKTVKVNGKNKKIYSSWSSVKNVTTK